MAVPRKFLEIFCTRSFPHCLQSSWRLYIHLVSISINCQRRMLSFLAIIIILPDFACCHGISIFLLIYICCHFYPSYSAFHFFTSPHFFFFLDRCVSSYTTCSLCSVSGIKLKFRGYLLPRWNIFFLFNLRPVASSTAAAVPFVTLCHLRTVICNSMFIRWHITILRSYRKKHPIEISVGNEFPNRKMCSDFVNAIWS